MKVFWVRFSVFNILWILTIVEHSEQIALSIIVFAIAMGIYFLLSLQKMSLLLYILLSSLFFIHGYNLMNDAFFTLLLLLFMTIDSAFRLKEKFFRLYTIMNLLLSLFITVIRSNQLIEMVIMSALFYFLVVSINRMSNERQEQKAVYEELLAEYRKLKRMNLEAESDARLQERTLIARDIHDSVGHRLTALIMKLEILSIQYSNSDYDELKSMAKESLEEIRKSVKALQTEENEGIATVVHLIRKLESESHIFVQFTMKQGILSVPFSNEKSVVLYRVIQEALTNAMRHSGAREVHVTLGKSATYDILFEISNTVFHPKPFTYGFGLTSMKNRIEEIKGTLEVYQTENRFIVLGTIPSEGGREICGEY
ncbi:sensor histidine kinase [Bacillus sp. V3B]|uniref:sensor histidine kinase n=1 Tax=Bacillus sp. V3B TaxID=2804915 RepID=UPI00210AC36C|nr:sensor histidine kinase [Bacillus sp. V3B]MCQ6275022.1 sensor histidine kinase [Bacillus sp. V3B]